jgi:hypothetical protein
MRAPWSRVTFTRLSHNAEKRSGKANTLHLPATAARNELHNILFLLVRAVVKASVFFPQTGRGSVVPMRSLKGLEATHSNEVGSVVFCGCGG